MKNIRFLLVALLFITAPTLKAQDIIITQEGDSHKVYEVEISASSVFYKLENKADAALQKMKKSDVLMIKFQDGRKVIMGDEETNTPAQSPTTEAANEPTAPLAHSPEIIRKNQEWIEQYNKENTFTVDKPEDKQAKKTLCTFGYKNNSILFTNEVKVDISFGSIDITDKNGEFFRGLWEAFFHTPIVEIKISNTSNRTIYIDLGNSFITQFNGEAITMYTPSATTTTESKSGGVGVNLGAVSSALGVGGAAGTLAQGVNVGGGKTTGTSSVTYSQRIIAIPAKSSKVINQTPLFNVREVYLFRYTPESKHLASKLYLTKDIKIGEKNIFNENETPLQFNILVSYSYEENCSLQQTLNAYIYLKEILGLAYNSFTYKESKIIPRPTDNNLSIQCKSKKE